MLLTLRTTHVPAIDLGFLLHKHPDKLQSFELPFGKAHVFYPEATDEACTAALLLDVDPVGLVRGRGPSGESGPLDQYVNDRPYVASSFLSVAIARVFGSALGGRSQSRQALAASRIPLEARLTSLPCRGGEDLLRRLFAPLGYEITAMPQELELPGRGEEPSRYFAVTLRAVCRLSELLAHLYVLVPVLDAQKHYYVGEAEVEKLLRHGEGWLASHPDRDLIARRYLKHRQSLVREAIDRLMVGDEVETAASELPRDSEEEALEKPVRLNERRLDLVEAVLTAMAVFETL